MLSMDVLLDAEGMAEGEDVERLMHVAGTIRVGAIAHGMQSGRPSVALLFHLPDGTPVLAETSLRLFLAAARAFAARYGWQDDTP